MVHGTQIIDEIKDVVYCASARYSDELREKLFEHVWTLYNTSRTDNLIEINRLFTGLGCSRNESFITRLTTIICSGIK